MPCTDGGVPYPPSKEELLNRKAPAMLCAVLRTMSREDRNAMANAIDWNEAGVTRAEFAAWWQMHVAQDDARREQESRAAAERATYEAAKAKLSTEELAALRKAGFK